jgi:outer membrane protein assembly factor BamB
MAKGPYSTPLVAGDRLVTAGATAVVAAWETGTGRLVWRKDFSDQIDTSKLFCGTAASPLGVEGSVVVQVGSDVHGGRIIALDPENGGTLWEWRGAGPGYASPIAIESGGQTQIVALTEQSIIGLAAQTGSELWSIPFTDEWHENIATPIWTGSVLIVSGPRQGTHAYSLQSAAGRWQPTRAWQSLDAAFYMCSPVVGDGLIYGLSARKRGQFVALDLQTGAIRWASEGRDAEQAAVLLAPGHVLFMANNGELVVARRGKSSFQVERRYKVAESDTWASPIPLGHDLIVRDSTGLIRLAPSR